MSQVKVCLEIWRFRSTRRVMGRAVWMAGASALEKPRAAFRGASKLGRPGASKGSAFAALMDAFLCMFLAHVYASTALLSHKVANAN